MFVFGDYIYTDSKRILQAFSYDEVIACLRIMQNHTKRKKKGYFVGYLTYECGLLLQDSYYGMKDGKNLDSKQLERSAGFKAQTIENQAIENLDSKTCHTETLVEVSKVLESKKDFSTFAATHTCKNIDSKKSAPQCPTPAQVKGNTESNPSTNKTNNIKEPLLYFELFLKRKKFKPIQKKYQKNKLFNIVKPLDKKRYILDFSRIKENIQQGHTYQVNYTQEILLSPLLKKDSFTYFKILSSRQNTPYKAYITNKHVEILSLSPELFFHYKNHTITTQPMKGTIKRAFIEKNKIKNEVKPNLKLYKQYKKIPKIKGIDKVSDFSNLKTLHYDSKNRSENVMIVDLLRNDLSRIGLQGSVRVKELFAIRTYPTLHQMVSTIQAKLPKHYGIIEILKALFPCGSITGAPKYKTTHIISELEQRKRGVYCGAIGVISKKECIMSVPIRTLYKPKQDTYYHYGVGSGVVWESLAEEEFSELQLKCKFLTDIKF
ncbi:anthranilate synthase component I family protein [Helicobacter bilis]|uniref:chorismate-binding protein n=1 Tax=Helicobacter bilis TaxID=37372 RepID=UPI002943EEFF|nr:anthranilate synthase component I family protein [Helicobacter bilis]